jgi:uncharacterized protein (TIGR03067 family)
VEPIDSRSPVAYPSASHSELGTVMKKMLLLTLAVSALLVALQLDAKPVPRIPEKAPAKIEDKDALQGDWIMEFLEQRGVQSKTGFKVTVKGDQWILYPAGAEGTGLSRTFRIDSSKNPKTFDLISQGDQVSPGIYKLEGDVLTMCRTSGTGDRPTEFKTTADGGILTVWKRASKAK